MSNIVKCTQRTAMFHLVLLLLWTFHIAANAEAEEANLNKTLSLKGEATSGPIVLVDKKTLLITSFRYNGDHQNVNFWAGNGSKPSADGVVVPDETGSLESLHPYQGQNVSISLPDALTTDTIDYFGIWSKDEELDLGHVIVKQPNDKIELRIPKCCPVSNILTSNGCEEGFIQFKPAFNVFEHNETHFFNVSLNLDVVDFQPYVYPLECSSGKYPLDENAEEFSLLRNGSLLVKGAIMSGVRPQTDFCIDNIDGEVISRILVCAPEYKLQKAMFYTYITLTIISTVCFLATFSVYFFWFKFEDVHRRCFTAYAFTMFLSFFSLVIVQLANVQNGACAVLGFLFQISMIASFTLLAILCVDVYVIVKYVDPMKMKRKRTWCYLGVGLAVPILSLIISLARNLTPDVPNSFFKPQYQQNSCYFEGDQRTALFYTPIVASILVSAVSLVMTRLKIVQNDKNRKADFYWMDEGTTYKFMFYQCTYTLIIMTVSWINSMLMTFLDESNGIVNAAIFIEALQGVFIAALCLLKRFQSESSTYQGNSLELNRLNHNNNQWGGENI